MNDADGQIIAMQRKIDVLVDRARDNRYDNSTMVLALVPTSRAVPAVMASGRSLVSRRTRTGLPSEGASSWMPPESVRMSVDCDIR